MQKYLVDIIPSAWYNYVIKNKPILIKGKPIGLPPLEEMVEDLAKNSTAHIIPGVGMIVEPKASDAARALGKIGGNSTHKRHPDHLRRISRIGVEKRWGEKK